jgi:hypothetical protein
MTVVIFHRTVAVSPLGVAEVAPRRAMALDDGNSCGDQMLLSTVASQSQTRCPRRSAVRCRRSLAGIERRNTWDPIRFDSLQLGKVHLSISHLSGTPRNPASPKAQSLQFDNSWLMILPVRQRTPSQADLKWLLLADRLPRRYIETATATCLPQPKRRVASPTGTV